MTASSKNPAREDPGVRPGDLIAGKYLVERIIGQGGMGVVVAAIHEQLDERVAVKLLRPEGASRTDFAQRFIREARAAVKIKSPHVARVLDVGTEQGGRPYMVMEYLDGRDLGEELALRGPLPEEVAVEYILDACDALAEAHALGIVHRDLKPGNLFLCEDEGVATIKVLDFGISKMRSSADAKDASLALTGETTLLGSPLYMSPEQVRSAKDVDERTDVWSLGVILHELVTGQAPFSGATAAAVFGAICADPPIALRAARPAASQTLESIVLSCLQKDLSDRVPSVRELVVALSAISPKKASVVLERIDRLLSPGGERTRASRVSLGSLPDADMLSETVGSFTQTSGGQRRRSLLLFTVIVALFAAFGTFVALSFRESPAPPGSAGPSNAGSVPAALASADPNAPTAPSPTLTVAPVVSVAPPASASASPVAVKPTSSAGPMSGKPYSSARPTSSPGSIHLGKEVETRR